LVKLRSGQLRNFQERGITLGENVDGEKEERNKESTLGKLLIKSEKYRIKHNGKKDRGNGWLRKIQELGHYFWTIWHVHRL
jgi:hypothetical protein